jgi:hypothetical protein
MRHRTFRSAAALAVGVLLASAAIVFADTVPADGRGDVVGVQRAVDLGHATPGQVVTWPVAFQLTCNGTTHAAPGDIIQLDPGSRSAVFGGAISATSTTIGPVPADWPSGGSCTEMPQTLDANAPSIVTLTMPTYLGNDLPFTMSWTRTGSTGLTGSTSMLFTIDVVPNTPPRLILPTDLTVEAVGPAGAPASFTATATDAEDAPAPTPTCRPASGSTFALGTTTVNCSVTDSGGLTTSGSFHVTVQDTTAPSLVLPIDQTAEATGPAGASVGFATSANDIVDGSVRVNCDHASGDTFPLGTTTVSCSATDAVGNSASGFFLVTVVDATAPVLALPPDQTAEATSPAGASVTFTTSASDIVDGSVSVNCDHASGDTFPLGTTTVSCSATDTAGNPTTGSFDVTVVDTTAPTLTGMPSDMTLTTGNPAGTTLTYTAPGATDAADPAPTVSCLPASGSTIPVGTTTITCTATDAAGLHASASFTASVTYVSPVSPTTWTATWGEPVASPGDTFVANSGRTIPFKLAILANGVAQTSGQAAVSVVACSGGTALSIALSWDGGRWAGHLDTSRLAGPGCYVVTAWLDGNAAGSFRLDLRGADVAPAPSKATPAPKAKSKP